MHQSGAGPLGRRDVFRRMTAAVLIAVFVIGTLPVEGAAAEAEASAAPSAVAEETERYLAMSLEDLLKLNVSSVTGVLSSFMASPAAIAVITGEDLRRGGFQSLPEAFRSVPGMQVARADSHSWAISVRGFNSGFAEKLLVLIDGRVVYDPLFTGVFWDIQDLVLEDVDRIEVIRGPGATLWGANAVAGVINITTKSAKQTQGLYVTTGGGSEERGFASMRYGGRVGSGTYYRVWGKHSERDNFVQMGTGREQPDDWNMSRGGLRLDHETSSRTTLTVDAEMYDSNRLGTAATLPVPGHLKFEEQIEDVRADGGHLLVRLMDGEGADSGWSVQAYADRTNRNARTLATTKSDTYDLDVRHHFKLGSRHTVMVGAGWRHVSDETQRGLWLGFDPPARSFSTFSGFVQDTVKLGDVSLMLGSKLEDNGFTGFEYQPSARLAWTPNDRHTLWGAVSRPVRTPNRPGQDYDVTVAYVDAGLALGMRPLGIFVPIKLLGNRELESEKLHAYEMGYRARLGERLSVDLAAYLNDHRNLVSTPLNQFGRLDNITAARGHGFEIAATLRASDRVRLDAAYTYTNVDPRDESVQLALRDAPHTGNLRARFDVTRDLELNGAVYVVDALTNTPAVGGYVRADLGMTWRPTRSLEIAVWGQNLLEDHHPEFTQLFPSALTEVQRGVYGQVTLRK
jgi:iron complex outermembrane recepter protein